MSLLFDTSSIFEAVVRGIVRVLSGNYTIELARYELGNIVWKKISLLRSADVKRYLELMDLFKKVLGIMKVINITCNESEILKLANELKITFYDASYVYKARELNIPLVTEDKELAKKISSYVKTLSIDEVLRKNLT